MRKCNECGNNHYLGALFCMNCGWYLLGKVPNEQPFFDLATIESFNGYRRTTPSDVLTATQEETTRLVFVIPNSGRQVEIDVDKTIRVGRSDNTREIAPELDLTEDEGVEFGVSREHALVRPGNQGISLIDLGSTNGTHLNSRRLPPNEPYPLGDGDTIRFGRLLVRVFFES
jgi:pSer/pThr/pTyr-binding forkhead associated (FHA) protein